MGLSSLNRGLKEWYFWLQLHKVALQSCRVMGEVIGIICNNEKSHYVSGRGGKEQSLGGSSTLEQGL